MIRYLSILLALVPNMALADFVTNSHFGIDSTVTGLDGTGIQIGQKLRTVAIRYLALTGLRTMMVELTQGGASLRPGLSEFALSGLGD